MESAQKHFNNNWYIYIFLQTKCCTIHGRSFKLEILMACVHWWGRSKNGDNSLYFDHLIWWYNLLKLWTSTLIVIHIWLVIYLERNTFFWVNRKLTNITSIGWRVAIQSYHGDWTCTNWVHYWVEHLDLHWKRIPFSIRGRENKIVQSLGVSRKEL